MNRLLAFLKSIRSNWIPESEVRAEAWKLGCRHHGEVVEGARAELREPDVDFRRSILLKAVIRRQGRLAAA